MERSYVIKKWYKKVTIYSSTGAEGPQYDPYSYNEYAIYVKKIGRREFKIVVHLGLFEWLSDSRRENKKGKEKVEENYKIRKKKGVPDSAIPFASFNSIVKYVKKHTGYSLEQIETYVHNPDLYCKKCKKYKTEEEIEYHQGFPGEHFIICKKCHNILDFEFHESEII